MRSSLEERLELNTFRRSSFAVLVFALVSIFCTVLHAQSTSGGSSLSLVQHVNNPACSTGTTCTITLNQSIAAGDLLVFESGMSGPTLMTATDNGGTFVQCTSCVGFDATYMYSEASGGWIISAAAEQSTITVTFDAAAVGGIEMWEYSYTGGTPGFDGANTNETVNSSSPVAATFTASGSNDISVQACRANQACDSVSAPYVEDNSGSDYSWAALASPAALVAPSWSLGGSGVSQLTQMEFGFGSSPCANGTFVDFGGPDGSAVTQPLLTAATHGWQGGYWIVGGVGADLTFSSSASHPLQAPTGRLCDGGNYTDTSTTGMQYSTSDPMTYLEINGVNGILNGSVSAGIWYNSTVPANSISSTDDFAILSTGGFDYVSLHEFGNGINRIGELECGSGTSTAYVILQRNTWYWVELVYNETGNQTMKVYSDASPPVQVGSTMTCPSIGTYPPGYILVGNDNPDTTLPAGYVNDFDGLRISLDGIDPLLPSGTAPPATAPAFNPTPGTYTSAQSVALSDSQPGTIIYYTTNGTTPTTSSAVYSSPIPVSASSTIQAIAIASGYGLSPVASGLYNINYPPAATPIFTPAPGNYTGPLTVTITETTANAVIHYTTDGSTPTANSPVYGGGPIAVSVTAVIQAIAVGGAGYSNSYVGGGTYAISPQAAAAPIFSLTPGTYYGPQAITLSDATPGATIYYTTNGTPPNATSLVYGGTPIPVSATTTIEAIATASNYSTSALASGAFTILALSPSGPVNLSGYYNVDGIATFLAFPQNGGFDNDGNAYNSGQLGTSLSFQGLTFPLAAANKLDALSSETVPVSAGHYQELVLLGGGVNGAQTNQTIVATYTDGSTSTFRQNFSDWANPQNYPGETTVSGMSTRVVPFGFLQGGAFDVYGYTFQLNVGKTLASVKLPANRNVVFLAIGLDSPVQPAAATPAFSPTPGNYIPGQTVTLSDATSGSQIHCTTNGTTPTANSPVCTTLTVSANTTIEAIAVASGYNNSAVATGVYTISPGVAVNLGGVYNVDGVGTSGTGPRNGGFDSDSYAYNSSLLGTSLTFQGVTFPLAGANVADAVTAQTISVSSLPYGQLYLLGAAVNGAQLNQPIVVTYTDGTTSTFIQSFSDWLTPNSYSGEALVSRTANRITPNGQTQTATVCVYGYTFALAAGKTVASVKLPFNRNVVFLGLGLGETATLPSQIVPYIQVNGASWQQTSAATVSRGSAVSLGPQPLSVGSWSWTGPGGYTSTARQINSIPLSEGGNTFEATYTNGNGIQSILTLNITVK
jgi:hypothetical protein